MTVTTDSTASAGRHEEPRKKPYRKPQIEDYGTVVELTGTGSGTIEDAGGPSFDFSGAAG